MQILEPDVLKPKPHSPFILSFFSIGLEKVKYKYKRFLKGLLGYYQ